MLNFLPWKKYILPASRFLDSSSWLSLASNRKWFWICNKFAWRRNRCLKVRVSTKDAKTQDDRWMHLHEWHSLNVYPTKCKEQFKCGWWKYMDMKPNKKSNHIALKTIKGKTINNLIQVIFICNCTWDFHNWR